MSLQVVSDGSGSKSAQLQQAPSLSKQQLPSRTPHSIELDAACTDSSISKALSCRLNCSYDFYRGLKILVGSSLDPGWLE